MIEGCVLYQSPTPEGSRRLLLRFSQNWPGTLRWAAPELLHGARGPSPLGRMLLLQQAPGTALGVWRIFNPFPQQGGKRHSFVAILDTSN